MFILTSTKMAVCRLVLLFMVIVLPDHLFAQTVDFTIVSPKDNKKMDYEGEFVSKQTTLKQLWNWDAITRDGWNMLISKKNYYTKMQLQFSQKSCVNGSSVSITQARRLELWNLWVASDGVIRSKCGPGYRLRRVGNWMKVIDDDPCKITEDDKFLFKIPDSVSG